MEYGYQDKEYQVGEELDVFQFIDVGTTGTQ